MGKLKEEILRQNEHTSDIDAAVIAALEEENKKLKEDLKAFKDFFVVFLKHTANIFAELQEQCEKEKQEG